MTSERRCSTTHREASGLDAFCQTCPAPEAVTTLLEGLGFHLSFQMDAIDYPAYTQLPSLPAQYHYTDAHGTQVIYLAGRDAPLDGERFPRRASRFWLFPGADVIAFKGVLSVLVVRWLLVWRRIGSDRVSQQVA
jgi:hypothetical protein